MVAPKRRYPYPEAASVAQSFLAYSLSVEATVVSNEENTPVPATDIPVQPLPQAASTDTTSAVQTEPSPGATTVGVGNPPAPDAPDSPHASAEAPDNALSSPDTPADTATAPPAIAAPAADVQGNEGGPQTAAPATDTPAAEPELPAECAELDTQVGAALKMVAHGANRLSKLAGNIRFAFLQRDEARLVSERKRLKADFAAGRNTEAELRFGLKTVLQKAERLAGSLMHVPAATTAPTRAENAASPDLVASAASGEATPPTGTTADTTPPTGASAQPASNEAQAPAGDVPAAPNDAAADSNSAATAQNASAPVAPALSVQRSGQIRQSVRKSMMALAPAAPLHLQIELAPEFADADPDMMAMAARIHAVHRQVLGSLRSILWHSPTRCTLGFEDGKTVSITFGDRGIEDLPPALRQKQQPASQKQSRPGDNRNGKSGGGRNQSRGAPANRRPGRDQLRPKAEGNGSEATQTATEGTAQRDASPRRPGNGQQGRHEGRRGTAGDNRNAQGKPRQGRPARPHGEQNAEQGQNERRHPRGSRNDDRNRGNRQGASGTAARGGKTGFPGNSAMADKLREALGGLNLSQKKRDGAA